MPTSSIVRNIEQQLTGIRKTGPPGMQRTRLFVSGFFNQILFTIYKMIYTEKFIFFLNSFSNVAITKQ